MDEDATHMIEVVDGVGIFQTEPADPPEELLSYPLPQVAPAPFYQIYERHSE